MNFVIAVGLAFIAGVAAVIGAFVLFCWALAKGGL